MECPFCAEEIKQDALVCKHCSRDLKIPLPLIQENEELATKLAEIHNELDRARGELRRREHPLAYWSGYVSKYVLPAVVLLVLAHAVMVLIVDAKPLFLRVITLLIPIPFGLWFGWSAHRGIWSAVLCGLTVGALSVAAMLALISVVDQVPFAPQGRREWREAFEYALSIALAYSAGAAGASLSRRALPGSMRSHLDPSPAAMTVARMIGPHVGSQAMRRRAERVQQLAQVGAAVGAAGAAGLGSIYTGLRALIGS